ncbi:MAG: autotransporter-associated beta strand repeat-containing protein [Pirellulales bacterium]|nr:autotransporter-associated beta strand repeat-containing protein [Pirellulales bacterium]
MNKFFTISVPLTLGAMLLAMLLPATTTQAVEYEWIQDATGNVDTTTNWDLGVVPTTGDIAYIRQGGTATITADHNFGDDVLYGLNVGNTTVFMGNPSSVTQTGGTVYITRDPDVNVGRFKVGVGDGTTMATDLATYTISGGKIDCGGWYSLIGYQYGYGKLDMSGDSEYYTASRLYVGDTYGHGILNMADTASVTMNSGGFNLSTGANTTGECTMLDASTLASPGTGLSRFGYLLGANATLTMGTAATGDDHTASMTLGGVLEIGRGVTTADVGSTAAQATVNLYDHTSITAAGKTTVGLWNWSNGVVNLYDNASFSVTGANDLVIGDANDGAGTYTVGNGAVGTFTVNDNATVTVGDDLLIGTFNSSHGSMTIGSGTGTATVTVTDDTFVGVYTDGDGTLTVNNGGVLISPSLLRAGDSGVGTITVNAGGQITGNAVEIGRFATGVGTFNLNGLLSANSVSLGNGATSANVSTLNIDGGTLKATASSNSYLWDGAATPSHVYIESGGATIDSNGHDIVVSNLALEQGTTAGGGLTKNGTGMLTLGSGDNTYTGATAVNAGGLTAYTNYGKTFGALTMAADTTLAVGKWDAITGAILADDQGYVNLTTSSLTVADGLKMQSVICVDTMNNLYGPTSVATGALAASGGSATVGVSFTGADPPSTGTYTLVSYTSNSGVTFMPYVDTIGTKGATITDDTVGTVSLVLSDINKWTNGAATGLWNNAGNWSTYLPNATNHRALFDGTGQTVGVNMAATVSSLTINADGYTLADNGGSITMDTSIALNAHINNTGGMNTIAAPIVLNDSTQVTVAEVGVDVLTLSGVVSGSGPITKVGTGALVLTNAGNTFSGGITATGGTIQFDSIANGSTACALGMASNDAANLVVDGGTLFYSGTAAASTDRGMTLAGNVTLMSSGDLTQSGDIAAPATNLTKLGAAKWKLAGPAGTQTPTTGYLNVNEGTMEFGGTNSTTYNIGSRIYAARYQGNTAEIILSGNSVTNAGERVYIGNGTSGDTGTDIADGTLTMTDSAVLNVTGSTTLGIWNYSDGTLTMSGDTVLNANGGLYAGDNSVGSCTAPTPGNSTITMSGNAQLNITGEANFAQFQYGVCNATLSGNASIDVAAGEDLDLARRMAQGTMTLGVAPTDTVSVHVARDFIVGDDGDAGISSVGTLNINPGTTVTIDDDLFIGLTDNATGSIVMTGGSLTTGDWLNLARTGANLSGTLTMSGDASVTAGGTFIISNSYGDGTGSSSGTVNMSGNATATGLTDIVLGWGGTGTLNAGDGTLTDNVVVTATNSIRLCNDADDGVAELNINGGGTVETPYINTAAGVSATVNFDGGVLKATADDTVDVPFIANTDSLVTTFALNVLDGGAVIDTNGFSATIAEALLEDAVSTGGGLTKMGLGTLTLGSTDNTYSGDTIVLGGTLSTADVDMMNDTSDLSIALNAVMDLDYTGTDTIGALLLDGASQALGTWGTTASGATHTDDTYFSGLGMVLVTEYAVQIPGDATGDGNVDGDDALRLATHWGATGTGIGWADGDFDGDHVVGPKDAAIMAAHWGYTPPSEGTSVPEPGTLVLLLGFALAAMLRRGSRR